MPSYNKMIRDALSGSAGIASFPASAAPADGVSLAEVLRIIYDAQQGSAGITTYPAAAAPANNVNLAEVLREIFDQNEKAAAAAAANLPQTTAAAIFTIAGGPILVTHLIGIVTTIIQTQANNTKLVANPTTGADTDMCAVLDVSADAVGTIYNITGTLADAMVASTNGAAIEQAGGIVVPAGTIDLDCAASNTGQVEWHMRYKPLARGVTVT